MSIPIQTGNSIDESAIIALFQHLLDVWDRRSASDFASLFEDGANVTGFDGSQMNGQAAIEAEIRQIFDHHQTAAYVGKFREVRFLAPEVAILRAAVGMVTPGQKDLNPAVNAIQSLNAHAAGTVDLIPDHWRFSEARLNELASTV